MIFPNGKGVVVVGKERQEEVNKGALRPLFLGEEWCRLGLIGVKGRKSDLMVKRFVFAYPRFHSRGEDEDLWDDYSIFNPLKKRKKRRKKRKEFKRGKRK